ncbi:MAG: hypothetical protein V2A69_10590 [Pseudomonadota bacterium]
MIKVTQWVLMIMSMVAVPLLKQVVGPLKIEAAKTETEIDDALVGAFEVVISALESGSIFVPKK